MGFAANGSVWSPHIFFQHYRLLLDELKRLWIHKSRTMPEITAFDTGLQQTVR
jgi:hypothetical protein